MPTLEAFHLPSPLAAALSQLGWTPEDPSTRDVVPTVARGHNLVAVTPPAPVYATPALAGISSRVGDGRQGLVLCPAGQLNEWATLVHRLAQGTGLRIFVARGTSRAMRLLRAGSVDLLITEPDTAVTLATRSVLRMETMATLVIAWPESWPDEDVLTPLMQDLPKESQRVVYTSEPGRSAALAERYARKALTLNGSSESAPAGPVRTVSVPWSGRIRALPDLLEILDPASLAIWTLDRSHHPAIEAALPGAQPGIELASGSFVANSTVIAFDLPTGDRLRELLTGGEVILLVPPGTESYVARIAAPRRPLALPGLVDSVRAEEAAQRRAIVQAIDSGEARGAVTTLAPLLERYDPVTVAAALFQLWQGAGTPKAPAAPEGPATSRVYVGAGKKDGVTANDLVAVLTKELRVDRQEIGRIELRDTFSLIEVPTPRVEQVASGLNGTTIRRRRVSARVDRGPTRGRKRE